MLGYLVERGRAFRAGPDPVPAIFEAMAAGDRDGLGDGAEDRVDLIERASAHHGQPPVEFYRQIGQKGAQVAIGNHVFGPVGQVQQGAIDVEKHRGLRKQAGTGGGQEGGLGGEQRDRALLGLERFQAGWKHPTAPKTR